MRYFTRPQPIQLRDRDKTPIHEPIPFARWLEGFPLEDGQVFGSGVDAAKSGRRILAAVEQSNGVIALEEADWERVCKAIRSPSQKWQPLLARQYVPFMDAVLDAKEEKPE
jgi:hypothetical protein